MKSPDPLDPVRIEVTKVYVGTEDFHPEITVTFRYTPWEPSAGQDVLWEQSNALACIRQALTKGGVDNG
jgi:hypothetical protein